MFLFYMQKQEWFDDSLLCTSRELVTYKSFGMVLQQTILKVLYGAFKINRRIFIIITLHFCVESLKVWNDYNNDSSAYLFKIIATKLKYDCEQILSLPTTLHSPFFKGHT